MSRGGLAGVDGKQLCRVTQGDFDVIDIQAVDDAGGWLYSSASPESPTQRYLYRTRLDGGTPRLARDLMGGRLDDVLVQFDRKGALPTTHETQGSDMGLFGGLMGWEAADERLPGSPQALRDAGVRIRIETVDAGDPHPNTYRLTLRSAREQHSLIAISTGGGRGELTPVSIRHERRTFDSSKPSSAVTTLSTVSAIATFAPCFTAKRRLPNSVVPKAPLSAACSNGSMCAGWSREFHERDDGKRPSKVTSSWENAFACTIMASVPRPDFKPPKDARAARVVSG